jgi:hypothetical protein
VGLIALLRNSSSGHCNCGTGSGIPAAHVAQDSFQNIEWPYDDTLSMRKRGSLAQRVLREFDRRQLIPLSGWRAIRARSNRRTNVTWPGSLPISFSCCDVQWRGKQHKL